MTNAYDLRAEPWLPLRRRSGVLEWLTPAELTSRWDGDGGDPIVAVASPRPDFDAALTEFLIGLFTTALLPEDEEAWRDLWHHPPTPAQLQARLDALPPAFELDGDGPRFFQDLSAAELSAAEEQPIQELLITAKNESLFVKPQSVQRMSRPAAAMALITLQTYSPAGGRGHRTSLRGGGPLTTLVQPLGKSGSEPTPLWHQLWANAETRDRLIDRSSSTAWDGGPSDIFPWLAPTRTSERNRSTTPEDAHPLQAYFGLPRRVRLTFTSEPGTCDVTGLIDDHPTIAFTTRPHGVQYVGWRHPLSPYYRDKKSTELIPFHGQPGGVGWRDWLAFVMGAPKHGQERARTTAVFAAERADRIQADFRVRIFGYDMSKAKAREWIESSLPAFDITDPSRVAAVEDLARTLATAADQAAYALRQALLRAWLASPEDAKGDAVAARRELWVRTEASFYSQIETAVHASDVDHSAAESRSRFRDVLAQTALAVFDDHVRIETSQPESLRRSIVARHGLVLTLNGVGTIGERLFHALALPTPKERRERDARGAEEDTG